MKWASFRKRLDPPQGEPGQRFRLPGLRLARARRRPPVSCGVLRERGQGRRRRRPPPGASRPTSFASGPCRSCSNSPTTGSKLRGGSPSRCSCDRGAIALRADLVGRRLRPDRRRAAGAGLARRGDLLHVGPYQQRGGVPLPAFRAGSSAPTTCPTARTCATNRAASASARRIGVGKGTVSLDDFDLADAIFVIGQNPGTNHPRMLSALEAAAARGCTHRQPSTRCPSGPERFDHPQDVAACSRRGTAIAELFLQVRINGDVALLKGIMKARPGGGGTPARPRPRPGVHRPSTRPASRSSPRHLEPSPGTRSSSRAAYRPRPSSTPRGSH